MPRSAAPNWRGRTPLRIGGESHPIEMVDAYIRASVTQAEGKYDAVTGFYKTLVINGIESSDDAKEVEKRLRASAYHHHRNGLLSIGVHVSRIKNTDGSYRVEFAAVNKEHTYAYMIQKYGEDRTKWPYSTNRSHPNYGR